MKFLYNNTLNLVTAQGVLLQDMRFWVRGQGGEKNYLNITEANDGVVSYSNENGDITAGHARAFLPLCEKLNQKSRTDISDGSPIIIK